MNDLPTLPDPLPGPAAPTGGGANPPASAPPQPPQSPSTAASSWGHILQRPMTIAVIVLAVLLGAQSIRTSRQIRHLREEMASRLQKSDATTTEAAQLVRATQEATKELQVKVGMLEGRQQEAQAQQQALEQLYNDMSKNRDEWALAEIEQVLSTASQQLQLAGNVPGALIALQNADSRLAKSDKPQFIVIRRAIAKDIEKLKALPSLDLPGIALRLDSVIAQVDRMPLWVDEKSVVT